MPSIDLGPQLPSPTVTALTGCRLWDASSETLPPPGEPCKTCRAIRSTRKRVVSGGIAPDDRFGCVACTCLQPHLERTAHLRGKPAIDPPPPPPRTRTRKILSAKNLRALTKSARGRVVVAMQAAEKAGDDERAGRLQVLLYRHRDGAIDDATLDRLAGTTPAETSAA